MNTVRLSLITLTLTMLFFSCQSIIELDLQNENKLVIEAYLRSDDSVYVRVANSADLTKRISKRVDGLQLFLSHNGRRYELTPRAAPDAIDNFSSIYGVAKSIFTTPVAGVLQLEADYNNKLIRSAAAVPEKSKIISFDFERETDPGIGADFVKSVAIEADFPNRPGYYIAEFWEERVFQGQIFPSEYVLFSEYFSARANQRKIELVADNDQPIGYISKGYENYLILKLYRIDEFHYEFY